MTFIEFQHQALGFLNQLFEKINQQKIKIEEHWNIDHLCYRVCTDEHYHQFKNEFTKFSDLLIESEVNGRLISTFKLHQPIYFQGWSLDLVELPAPKIGKKTIEGFEHIEIVCDLDFDDIKKLYPNCKYNEGGLKKNFNQELEINLDDRAIKFHHLSLESVIQLEKNTHVFSALKELKILEDFKKNKPLIAGTFPLGLAVHNSDIDVIMSSVDLDQIKLELTSQYSQYKDFKIKTEFIKNEISLICNFNFQEIAFEIFVQHIDSVKQTAYRHFLIEERLLKLGQNLLLEKIRILRKQGLKTEPAFTEALGLHGDAYQILLDLQRKSESELKLLLSRLN